MKGEFGERETENEPVKKNDEVVLNAFKSAIYNESYIIKILLKANSLLIAYTGYPEYPITVFEDDHFWTCIEGKIYGKDYGVLRKELDVLLNDIFDTPEQVTVGKNSVVANWLSKTDGEFIIYALDKKNKDFIVVNDVLGRLPLYYYYNDNYTKIIISRDMQIISSLIWNHGLINNDESKLELDKLAVAQYLLFGFMLGNRTLLDNVYRLKPATLIRGHSYETSVTVSCLYTFNFDNKRYANEDIKSNADKLTLIFTEACKNRAASNGKNNIISLSGGFDSRCVAACLFENKIPFSAITYVQPGWAPSLGTRSEVEVAEQLANEFQCELINYGLIEPVARDFLALLKIKFGLNYLDYSYILPLLEKLQQYHGSEIIFFTGDGGDRLLPVLKPSKKLKNMDDLIDDILDRFGSRFFPKNDVAAITRIREDQIVEELRKILSSYPEKRLDQKFVHFMLYEAVFNDLFESEDRNRAYFWSVSPYYSVPFFDYSMNCSDGNKSHSRLQKKFLLTISPSAAAIDKAEYGCSILSKRYRLIEFIISLKQQYPRFSQMIGKLRRNKGNKDNSKTIKCLKNQLFSCGYIWSYFERDRLDYVLNNSKRFNPSGISVLFTIMSLVETVFCNQSSIKKYFV